MYESEKTPPHRARPRAYDPRPRSAQSAPMSDTRKTPATAPLQAGQTPIQTHQGDKARSAPPSTYQRQINPKNGRITKKVKIAIDLMIQKGLHPQAAGPKAGMTYEGLYRAMRKPHVKRYIEERKADFIQSFERDKKASAVRALHVANDLMNNSRSDAVRMKAVEFVARVGGISPIDQSEIHVSHSGPSAGYAWVKPGQMVVDITPETDTQSDAQAPQDAEIIEPDHDD